MIMLSGWHEPKNYFRPGEDPELNNVIEGQDLEGNTEVDSNVRIVGKTGEKETTSDIKEK